MVILGIDPGSRVTGYGLVRRHQGKLYYVASGCIRLTDKPLAPRLDKIFIGVSELIEQFKPDCLAIEQVFLARNPDSALKLGHARGAAMIAATQASLSVSEYSARQIKQAVVGTGGADKTQVQHMVTQLLSLSKVPGADAADALAIAICHLNHNGIF